MDPAVSPASPGDGAGQPPIWDDRDLALHPDRFANEMYTLRVDRLDLELLWNNTATEYADLYLAAGRNGSLEHATVGADHRQLPGSGASRETLTWDTDPFVTRPEIRVGPVTNTTALSTSGLSWRVTGTATLVDAPIVVPQAG